MVRRVRASFYLSIYLSLSHPTREAAAVESSTSLGVILRWSPRSRALSSRSTAAAPPTSPDAGGPRTRAEEAHHTWLGLGCGFGFGLGLGLRSLTVTVTVTEP